MSAWSDEYAPASLQALASQVRSAFALPAVNIGIKGDESHNYGYHRSRRWINEFGQGTRDYSNQLAPDKSGDANWLSALDVSLDAVRMKLVTGRVINAMKAKDPRVAAVREVFGTLDGRTVAGWDAARNAPTTSDDSHLWHLHLSFYRSRANDDHSGVLAVLTGSGTSTGGTVMGDYTPVGPPNGVKINGVVRGDSVMIADLWGQELNGASPYDGKSQSMRTAQLGRIEQGIKDARADIAKLPTGGAGGGGEIDIPLLAQALAPYLADVIRDAVRAELAQLTLVSVQHQS